MRQGVIYKITNPSGKVYIGQSVDFKNRVAKYKNLVCEDQRILFNSLKKYGFENHSIEVIYEGPASSLPQKEIYYIKKHNSFNGDSSIGMNLTKGGDGSYGRVQSEEEKIKRANKIKGQKRSKVTREKMSQAAKGSSKILSSELLEQKKAYGTKLGKSNKGRQRTDREIKKWRSTRVNKRFDELGHILQLDLDGNIVKKWPNSITEVAKSFGVDPSSIRQALVHYDKKTSMGYKWKYEKL